MKAVLITLTALIYSTPSLAACRTDLCCFHKQTYVPGVCASGAKGAALRKRGCPKGYALSEALNCTGRRIVVPGRGHGDSNRQTPAPGQPPIIPGPGIPCTDDLCLCASDGSNVVNGGYCN